MFVRPNLGAGLMAGTIGGLAGSWLMLQFIKGPGSALLNALKTSGDHAQDAAEERKRGQSGEPEPETVTMQAADVFAHRLLIGRHLTRAERERAGTAVHYTFGAAMGAFYGIAAEYTTLPTLAGGLLFGTALWAGTDLLSVPAVGFAKWPSEEPPAAHVTHLLAHLVFASSMETTRRLLRC